MQFSFLAEPRKNLSTNFGVQLWGDRFNTSQTRAITSFALLFRYEEPTITARAARYSYLYGAALSTFSLSINADVES